jgi:spore germination protein YaaH
MNKKIVIYLSLFVLGFGIMFLAIKFAFNQDSPTAEVIKESVGAISLKQHQAIGFLPYWLLDKADKNYSKYLTEMIYFALTVNSDGTIQKYVKPGEAEPGWYALTSGKFIRPSNFKMSLAVFSGDPETINQLISEPEAHAAALAAEVGPIMKQYGFIALNLDLESVLDASESARQNFTAFVSSLKANLNQPITIDASPTDLVKTRLIDLKEIGPLVDSVILMTYDYHYSGSLVTGPVAPNGGAGIDSEFDTETGIQKALEILPAKKIILGVPLYGYEWETLTPNNRAAVLPGSGIIASNRRVEEFLSGCASCSAQLEAAAQESYLVYWDEVSKTYHQLFYPDESFMKNKIALAGKYNLGGVAFWALGYEGKTLLNPVAAYLK